MKKDRQLGWTTIEEAKLLVEAGLDPNTADMSYNFVVCKVINGNPSEDWLLQPFSPDENQPHKQLPCWSLGALIGLMPPMLNNGTMLSIQKGEDNSYLFTYLPAIKNIAFYGDLTKSAVDIILFLLENGYIKKQE